MTVPYTLSGTATPSDDYTGTASGSVTIMAGQGSATITVPVRGDLLHEGNETVTVTLGDPDHAALHATQKTATGTITDNDAKPTAVALSVSPDAVAEGDDSSATTVTVTATVTGATRFGDEKTVTVAVGDAGDSAAEGIDYGTVGAVTVTLPAGADAAEASFGLTPTDDSLDEEDEEISVTGAVTGETSVTVAGAAITITDDDDAVSAVSVANASAVTEGNDPEMTTDMTFAVSMAPVSGRLVTVPYTLDGTATPGDDYTGTASGSVTITAGASSATITVPVRGDVLDEANETVTVTLGNPTNADISSAAGAGNATGTITDDDAAVAGVTLSVSPDTVGEDDGEATTVTVTATVTGATRYAAGKTVTVAVGDAGDSAAEGTDYGTVGDVTVTIPPGADTGQASFDLTPTDDTLDEEDEAISVTGAVSGEPTAVTGAAITITDDDSATSVVSIANASAVAEGNDPGTTADMTFALTLAPASGRDVTVPYTLSGTATPSDDYTGTASGSVTIMAGQGSATITVPVRGDLLHEGNETVTVTLGDPDHAALHATQKTATGTITDNDAKPTAVALSVSPDAVAEGDDSSATTVTVTATVTGATRFGDEKTVTVAVGDAGDSAAEGIDYGTVGAVTVTLPAGADAAEASFGLTPTDDSLDEEDEEISVTGAVTGETSVTVAGAAITITDDDDAVSAVSVANASAVTEGNDPEMTTDMTFAVSMAPVSGRLVTVPYTLDGTATPGDDYTGTASGSVTITAGASSATITVPVRGDVLDEANETVTVTLGNPTNADISSAAGAGNATGTITDDDAAVAGVTLSVSPDTVGEDDGEATTVTVTATVTGATRYAAGKTVTVAVGDAGDSAAEGTDYGTVGDVTVTIPPGADTGQASFDLTPTDDTLDEEDEAISVTGAVSGEPTAVTGAAITITDDDSATSVVSIANASAVAEGNDPGTTADMTFALTLAPASGRDVTVPYTLSGTATPSDDYTGTASGSVTIMAGQGSATITVPVRGDLLHEGNETVTVTLGDPDHAALHATQKTATGTITDNDAKPTAVALSVSPDAVAEGDDSSATTVTVTATVTGATRFGDEKTVTVAVGDAGDSAAEGIDYGTVGAVTVTLPAGADAAEASFGLTPTDDSLDEEDEEISVTGAVTGETSVTVAGAAITITDDDDAVSAVSVANASAVTEGNDPEMTTDMTFAVSMAPVSGRLVTVPYTLDGTATPGDDYTGTASGSVTITAGASSATITVPVRGDVLDEANETVTVTLGNPTNADISSAAGAGNATGTITDDDAAVAGVTLSVSPDTVGEDDGEATTVTVTATVTGATRYAAGKTVTVAVGDAGDSAAEGTDYGTVGDVTVTIPPGADTGQASFDLTPTDDTLDEEDEAISVTGAVSGEPTAVTGAAITITDDDSATSVVSIANASAVAEGNDPGTTADMTFALTLAPASGRDVTVPYTLSGTATPSDDYTGTASGSVTIMAGQGSATITVPVRGDLLHEGNETVTVTLGDPDHAALHATQKTATGTITDNDAKPTAVALSVSPDAVAEGDDSSATTVTVTATVTGATRFGDEKTVTVAVGDAGDSAAEGIDYGTVGAVTVTLPAGADAAEASFGLTPTDDSLDEEDEEISVTGAVTGETSVTVAGAAITITDDDDAVSAVSVANASAVTEGNDPEMTTDMTFAVSMAPVSGRLVTVPYTLDGTATPGDDYTGTASGSVTITAGASSATITVPVRGDVLDEANETVTVTLGNPTNADISSAAGAGNATGTITDDDAAVAGVTLSVSPDTVGEDDGEATTVTVTATVTGATRYAAGKTVTVAVGDAGDSAAEGTDYGTVGDVTVTIPPGADTGQASFDLTPTDDTLDEEDEAISVTGAVSGEPTAVTGAAITITDDDSATSVVSIANASAVAEGNDPGTTADMTFALTLAPASGRDVTVPYTLSGTATPSDDYTGTASGSVTIMAGQGSATITVPVRGDLLHEGNETVTVTLGDPDHAALHATQKTATGTITDNDAKPTAVALSVSPDAVAEGDDSSATTVTVTATVTGATRFGDEKTVTVAVGDAGDSAAEGIDYGTVGAVTVTLPAGADAAEASFGLTPTDDSLDEEDEEISVTGAVTGETSVTVAGAAITITDDDDAVSAVSVANASAVTEGNDPEMTTDMTFAVSMAPVSGRLVTVPYTLDGTATPGDDYTGTASGSVTITAGASSATITVPVRGDVLDEANETVTVTLGNPTNADISSAAGAGNATGTITDDDAAVAGVTLSVSPDTVGEDDGEATTVTVTATVTGATRYAAGKTVTVAVGDAGDSAAEGTDYGTVGDVTVTIPPGADTGQASFDLTPTDDTLDEEDEAISVTGAVSGEPTAVTGAAITITDDDSATSVVSIANASAVAEGNDPGTTADMTFALTLAPASGRDVTVPYTLSGTATPSDDYTGTASGSVTIMAGQGSATITVPVRGDLLHEGNETVTVTLGDPDHAALHATQKTATGTITDNDAKPTAVALSVSPDAVAEGDDSSATTVTVTATVTGATRFGDEKTVTVAVGDAGDSAAEGIDYGTVGAVTVTLPAGADAAEASFGLTPTDDSLDEEDEEISVTGAVTGETSVTVAGAAITITDDDDAVSAVSVANASAVTEGNDPEMTTDMTFAVSMAPVSGRLVTVPYTLDGTATPGDDYTGTASGSVTITAGASSATITVPVRGDVLDEANETVTVTLGNPTNADISSAAGAGNATGTITDDDAAVAGVTLSVSPDTVGEDDGEATTVTVTATVTGATRYAAGKTVTVAVGDAGDSAAEGTDYGTVGDVTVTIPPGADTGQASFDLTPTDDTLDEEDEAISVTGAVSGEPTAVTGAAITITDDDSATSVVSIANASAVAEGNDPGTTADMTFALTLAPASGRDVTVPYTLSGTATPSDDYTGTASGSVTIMAGQGSATITVPVRGDLLHEGNETVTVTLGDPDHAALHATQKTATGTITDNDAKPTAVALSVSPDAVAEGDDSSATTVTVTATVTGATRFGDEKTVTVAVGDAGDSAAEGIDYGTVGAVTVTLPAGADAAEASFGLTPTDDSLDEEDEEISVTGAVTGETSVTVAGAAITITDDDDAVSAVSVANASAVTEGNDPEMTTDMTFAVSMAPVSGRLVTVPYTLDGTATPGDDYTGTASGSVTITAGASSATITVPVRGDVLDEANETVTVTLGNPTNADISSAAGAGNATGTITDDDAAVAGVTLSVSPDTVGEDDGEATTVTVTATVTGATRYAAGKTVTVAVGDAGDSAAEGTDYGTVGDVTVTIPPGADTGQASFDLTPTDDTLDEEDEAISVTGAVSGEPTAVTGAAITITDDDSATSVVSIANASAVAEGNDPGTTADMTFALTLAPASGRDVTVPYTLSGTATPSDDYTGTASGSVTIMAGQGSATITVPVRGDLLHEGNETVTVTLGDPDHAALHATQKTATGTITDNDAKPTAVALSVSPDAVAEGDDSSATTVTVTATVTGATRFGDEKTVTVAVGDAGDSAAEGIDYGTVGAVTVTLPAGADAAEASFGLTPTDDSLDEEDEEISVTGAVTGETSVTVAGAAITITDDDDAVSAVSVANASAVTEGNDPEMTTDMTFAVSMAPVSGRLVTVPYTLDGTATPGDDYTGTASGSVTITAGASSATITVPVRGDVLDEANETVTVTLGNPTNADISSAAGAGNATGTITDDDAAVAGVTLSVSPDTVGEDDGEATTVTVTATVTGATRYAAGKTVTVAVGDAGDSAAEGTDYGTVGDVTVTIPPGADTGQASFDLTPTDDTLDEEDEAISVTGAVSGEPTAVTGAAITITDDDSATSVVSIANASAVAEGNDPGTTADMTFALTLAPASGRDVTVPYTLSGTATPSDDYTGTASGSVTIMAGQGSATITVPVRGDLLHEGNETVTVTLGDPDHAALHATQKTATGTITDNDAKPTAVALSVSPDAVAEGDDSSATTVTVTATVTGTTRFGDEKTVTVAVGDAGDSAAEGIDYGTVGAVTVTLPAGADAAEASFGLTPTDDSLDEEDEEISVTGAVTGETSVTVAGAAITITDDDDAVSAVSVANASAVTEGNDPEMTTDMTFAVSMAPVSGRLVTVPYTLDGTATPGDDYTGTASGSVTITAGASSATITVPVRGDVLDEANETVTVTLGNPHQRRHLFRRGRRQRHRHDHRRRRGGRRRHAVRQPRHGRRG